MGKVKVKDPFGAASDPSMLEIAMALDRRRCGPFFKRGFRKFIAADQVLRIHRITVLRHKPGKRCVIRYDIFTDPPGDPAQSFAILGKIRANRAPNTAFNLQQAFWDAGFDSNSADGISVPEPVGIIDELQMWFQSKCPGQTATALITPESAITLPQRIAAAAVKIHRANVPTEKSHLMADELRILKDCFARVTKSRPELSTRLTRLLFTMEVTAARLGDRPTVGIHRDFYADQILFDGQRVYVLDLDLYCMGDPALDIGNFIGHLTEQSLRLHNRIDALQQAENALRDCFVELSGPSHRFAVDVYTNLTLARHIYLSAQFPDRANLTEPLLLLCEERFSK
jgi:hypothetical protein